MDDVKAMNQMVLYSKVVTIRDKQLQENKKLESEWIEEQKKLDLMMEIERLRYSRKKKSVKLEKLLPESKVLKSLSIKFKRELLKE